MAIAKVLMFAVSLAVLFGALSVLLIEMIERVARGNASVVQLGIIGVGAIIGAIAGAAQAVVDAIASSREPRQ